MNEEQQEIYDEGYRAYESGESAYANPYSGLDAEFWSDGYDDAACDELEQSQSRPKLTR